MKNKTKHNIGSVSIFFAGFFLTIVGVSVITSKIPFVFLVYYMAISLLTFIMYALDKSAAREGRWRTQESILHILSLVGGWPGAIVAQQKLRHKSQKQSFRFVFWVTALINSCAFFWLFTSYGTTVLKYLTDSI